MKSLDGYDHIHIVQCEDNREGHHTMSEEVLELGFRLAMAAQNCPFVTCWELGDRKLIYWPLTAVNSLNIFLLVFLPIVHSVNCPQNK